MPPEKPTWPFEFEGNTYEEPIVLVEDRDGDLMPYHPAFNPEMFEEDPLKSRVKWGHWWATCGHLIVDHHVDDTSYDTPGMMTMRCWAVGCENRIGFPIEK